MKKNDLVKTEEGIFRIISIGKDRILAIDCAKKTMPKFYTMEHFQATMTLENIERNYVPFGRYYEL